MPTAAIPPFRPSLVERLLSWWASRVDLSAGWWRLPRYTGLLALSGLRVRLRKKNLYDTSRLSTMRHSPPIVDAGDPRLTARTADGSMNDLKAAEMGRAGTRFGRNVPLKRTFPEPDRTLLTPSPRLVSRQLLTRERFIPATSLNLLAAAWIQFMVHDWLSHGKNQKHDPWRIELEPDDDWPQRPMEILRTHRDPTRPRDAEGSPPTLENVVTHWWDASQLYGSDVKTQAMVRSGEEGKLRIGPDGLLPLDPKTGIEVTGVSGNWWLGLELMHTLFTLEHNAICARLRSEYPSWGDQELFDRARIVNAALLAKIHTVEWTPAILAHPTIDIALRANWWGIAGEHVHRLIGRIGHGDSISGIPGSTTEHFGVPYSITEEFVAVYRMHPLLRDEYVFRSLKNNSLIEERGFSEVAFKQARNALESVEIGNAIYSFGVMNPGAITLHNHPKGMQRLEELDGTVVDLAATDVLRIRERGVPRYNEFRKLLHRAPVGGFEDLSPNREWVEQIRGVYDNKIDMVDLLVGLYAEQPPAGFGFSDTAFRIFILMASRRLNSDRFFTTDFTPEVYTPVGMRWLDDNGFASVLVRHYPSLRPALRGVRNPFAPWARV